ncbi:MAG: hypothetical protein HYR56_33585 [Acidobacteria bacterium]|nr:hypothetical protein [Acidobacteriota bacterium]MBI3422211.1 hypothetical protein [Acidobacteriota bacterium]
MQTELIKKTLKTGGKALELGVEAERMKQNLAHKLEHGWEDGMLEAKRALKRTRYAAEDLVDDTAYRVKQNLRQNPWGVLAITLGLGFGIGTLTGALITRLAGRCKEESR